MDQVESSATDASRSDGQPDLTDPALYINRELSLLEFNSRVLAQARDTSYPLLERLRFLTICSLNLDECFEVRVAGLRQQSVLNVIPEGPDGMRPREVLTHISETAHQLVNEQYRVLNDELLPALEAQGVYLIRRHLWDDGIRSWVEGYFRAEVYPVLTPVGLDPAHPFPMVVNKSLNFFVTLSGKDAFGRTTSGAVVQAPRILPRLIRLPASVTGREYAFVTLTAVIQENVGELFPGMKVRGCYGFRVTRDSDLWVNEEEVDDLLRALKGELMGRNYRNAVRIELDTKCPPEVGEFLTNQFDLDPEEVYQVNGPVNLNRLAALYDMVDLPRLKFRPFVPAIQLVSESAAETFERIREKDILLHHPFESFSPVLEMLKQAAVDRDVLAIKMTLYRTGASSPLTNALLDAARNGKEVTAVIELRARFDEAENIDIATRLQETGAKVVYGVVGYKAHAKMMLIVRREAGGLRRYVHLGTGNYHLRNTTSYTDFGLLSADPELGEDVHALFQQLTGLGKAPRLKRVVQAPFNLHERMLELIEQETRNAAAGRPAHVRAKMNALIDPAIIRALYRASAAGVQIDLIVRGICSLRPGISGVSENIRVRSIVGRFLEHNRVFNFHAGGEEITYCSSADWMQRNFFRRVETCFPVERRKLKRRVLEEGIELYLADNVQAWELSSDGRYHRTEPGDAPAVSAQAELLRRIILS